MIMFSETRTDLSFMVFYIRSLTRSLVHSFT